MSHIRVFLIHDSGLVRRDVRRMLEEGENIEVVGEASTPLEALSQVEKVSPDVIAMDGKLLHVSEFAKAIVGLDRAVLGQS